MSSFQAATAGLDWMKEHAFNVSLTDAPRADAYPIMAASFALMHRYPKGGAHSRDVLAFFQWALENGRDMATSLDYLPLPPPLVQEIEDYWDAELGPDAEGPALTRASRSPG
jgi:phosphate transport system substrate-binding protein